MRDLRQAADRDAGGRSSVDGVPGPLDGGQPEASDVSVPTTTRNPRPLRVTRHDVELGCDVRRVVGYVASCPICGEQTRTCSTWRIARLALDMHKLAAHR